MIDTVEAVMHRAVEACAAKGVSLDFEKHLPPGEEFTARQVINAIGKALTDAGIPNNLVREG